MGLFRVFAGFLGCCGGVVGIVVAGFVCGVTGFGVAWGWVGLYSCMSRYGEEEKWEAFGFVVLVFWVVVVFSFIVLVFWVFLVCLAWLAGFCWLVLLGVVHEENGVVENTVCRVAKLLVML